MLRMFHPKLYLIESTSGSSVPPISPLLSRPEAQKEAPETGPPDEGVFLTQVDDQDAEEEDEEESEPDILSYTASTVHIPDRYKVHKYEVIFTNLCHLKRFTFLFYVCDLIYPRSESCISQGFEDLVDVDDDPDDYIPEHIQVCPCF